MSPVPSVKFQSLVGFLVADALFDSAGHAKVVRGFLDDGAGGGGTPRGRQVEPQGHAEGAAPRQD